MEVKAEVDEEEGMELKCLVENSAKEQMDIEVEWFVYILISIKQFSTLKCGSCCIKVV